MQLLFLLFPLRTDIKQLKMIRFCVFHVTSYKSSRYEKLMQISATSQDTFDAQARYQSVLLDYAAGSLPSGPAFVVAAHLALRPDARAQLDVFDAVGGLLLDGLEPAQLATPAWIEDQNVVALHTSPKADAPNIPHVLSYLDSGRWKRNLAGMLMKPVHDGSAQLLKIEAGRDIPHHDHRGLELTLVISGTLEDGNGVFRRGDLVVHDEDSAHQPSAGAASDCICLIAQTGPVRLSGAMGWLINPFLK